MYNIPLAIHEEEVHTHEYANSRDDKTKVQYQSLPAAIEGGTRHVMG
jgi:hypothetical protein